MRSKVYDCFTYFNEDQLLKLRLETLWDQVDFFVICESVLTHAGNSKSINFNINNFYKYKEKIRYLIIDKYDFISANPWDYENYQRNFLMNGLWDAVDKDWVIVSDLDEIPNPDTIKMFDPQRYPRASLIQKSYTFFLNNLVLENGQPFLWDLAKITTFRNLKTIFKCPEELRHYKSRGIFRGIKKTLMKHRTQLILNGGWHFTWMGGVEKIIAKVQSTAHQEINTPQNRDPERIKEKLLAGQDVLGINNKNMSYQIIDVSESLPTYLSSNKDEFSNLILNKF